MMCHRYQRETGNSFDLASKTSSTVPSECFRSNEALSISPCLLLQVSTVAWAARSSKGSQPCASTEQV